MELLHNLFILFARIFISSLYIWASVEKIFNWNGTIEYMQSKHFPFISFMLPAAVILQILGGLSLLVGFYTRIGAFILIMFTIPAMIKMHNFWSVEESMRIIEKTFFMKDVAIVGGLLLILVIGAGDFSLDKLLRIHRKF